MIAVSTVADGSMKSTDGSFASVLPARTAFLQRNNIDPTEAVLVHLTYDGDEYTRFVVADEDLSGDGITRVPSIVADALITTTPDLALFLPLADCIGAVIHDTAQDVLMLSHLGRHNLEQHGGTRSIEYLVEHFDSNPADIEVWLSPAAGGENYPLHAFNNRSMQSVATEQLVAAGILPEHIVHSPIDVTQDENYFSHSEFLKGNRDNDGRFAVVAKLLDSGDITFTEA